MKSRAVFNGGSGGPHRTNAHEVFESELALGGLIELVFNILDLESLREVETS